MTRKAFSWTLRIIAVLIVAVALGAQTPAPLPTHFKGIINDYTPETGVSGPWELHGTWSMKLKRDTGKADFSAVLTMEHSDAWIAANPGTSTSPNIDNPASRSAHTHNITMTDVSVSLDTSVCPENNPATTTPGFVITGPVNILANGSAAPFEVKGPSTLQVCVNGGALLPFSNVTLALSGPAATLHFGGQPIHGVVRVARGSDRDDRDRH